MQDVAGSLQFSFLFPINLHGLVSAYFSNTAASKSAMLLSILNRSFRAREKERAIVLVVRQELAEFPRSLPPT